MQAIPMANDSTLAVNPGALFQIHDDGTVSVVNPSIGTIDIVGDLATGSSSLRSTVENSKSRLNGDYPTELRLTAISHDPGKSSTSFVRGAAVGSRALLALSTNTSRMP